MLVRDAIAPAATAFGQGIDLIGRQTQHTGDITHRASGVIGVDHCGERCAVPAITPEHVLDHFFAPVVLEVDVDVRWLVALA
ncbi:hypothetical protein D3C79_1033920 [compost metagenome]